MANTSDACFVSGVVQSTICTFACNPHRILTWCMRAELLQSCLILQPHGLQAARLLCPWRFSRQEY